MAAPEYLKCKTQADWKEYLVKTILTSDKAVVRAILAIYRSQTEDERITRESTENNGVGFTKYDAPLMSKYAELLLHGPGLTQSQVNRARHIMKRYWRQLMVISKRTAEKERAKLAEEEEAIAEAYGKQNVDLLDGFQEEMRECITNGKACQYGICSECPIQGGCNYEQMSLW